MTFVRNSIGLAELPLRQELIGGMALGLESRRTIGPVAAIGFDGSFLEVRREWVAVEDAYRDDIASSIWVLDHPPGGSQYRAWAFLNHAVECAPSVYLVDVFAIGELLLFPRGMPVIDLGRIRSRASNP